jgi:hypothetical protein
MTGLKAFMAFGLLAIFALFVVFLFMVSVFAGVGSLIVVACLAWAGLRRARSPRAVR